MSPDDPRHGTPKGYAAHRRAGSDPCRPCRVAAADYERHRFYDAHLGRERLVDVTGSRRRIRALQAIGWPTKILTAELGYTHRDALAPLLYDARQCTRTRAEKIADLYERLCMTPGPSNITRVRALRAGYAPPLAWDDIDDPDEEPTGWQYVPQGRRESLEELVASGESITTACRQLKVSRAALQKWCANNGLRHVYRTLAAREAIGTNQYTDEQVAS